MDITRKNLDGLINMPDNVKYETRTRKGVEGRGFEYKGKLSRTFPEYVGYFSRMSERHKRDGIPIWDEFHRRTLKGFKEFILCMGPIPKYMKNRALAGSIIQRDTVLEISGGNLCLTT